MKKSLLALAVLGVFASAASAQSSVTLSGRLDAGLIRSSTPAKWIMDGSQSGYNNFTISGREDLGGGMNAFFAMNHRFSIQSGGIRSAAGVFWRNIWVGLGGGFGDVRLGRVLMPLQDMNGGFDAFDTGTVGSVHTGGITATIRAHNAIYYRSPSMGGLSIHAAIAASDGQLQAETANNFGNVAPTARFPTGERPTGFNVRYAAGPLNIGAAWDKNAADIKTTGFYASYDFGAIKPMFQYEKGDSSRTSPTCIGCSTLEEMKNMSFGATAPMGPVLIRAGYVRVDSNIAGRDGSKLGFGGDYSLSKRTYLYSNVGKFRGDRFKNGLLENNPNKTDTMFDIGVNHKF